MKTAISIPDSLFEAAEQLANRLGISRSELYQRAVARLLQEKSGDAVTASLNAVYAEDEQSSDVDSILSDLQLASTRVEDW